MANIYKYRQWSLALFRLVIGFIFAYHGYLKLFVPGGFKITAGFMASIFGVSPFVGALLALVVSVTEIVGGLFLMLGFLSKWAAIFLIIDMLVALSKVHAINGFLVTKNGYEFVALLIFSLFFILLNGPGSFSLDRAIFGAEEEDEKTASSTKKPSKSPRKKVKDFEGNGVVASIGIEKKPGYLYFLDKNGDVARVKMARRGEKSSKRHELISKIGIKRKEGYLYFIDKHGNVSQARMARG